jgi:hypothetical protein
MESTQVNHSAISQGDLAAEYPVVMRSVWKWIGLAGVAGVVAGGALVVRDQRKRRAYTADEIRARLHQRLAESNPEGS